MKKLVAFLMVGALLIVSSSIASATSVSLSGTLSGVDSNAVKDDGDGNHDYAIDRTIANTFYWSGGSPVSITGTVDVRDLTSGSYLEIGLVDKEYADYSLDTSGWGGYMFNDSAFATFYVGNYAKLADTNYKYSASLPNPGTTGGVFNFGIDIASDGTMSMTLHGTSDVSTTYTYGVYNSDEYYPGDPWLDYLGHSELTDGAYLLAQLWIDTADTQNPVNAEYDIKGSNSVPEPATMMLLGLGLVGLVGLRRRFSN